MRFNDYRVKEGGICPQDGKSCIGIFSKKNPEGCKLWHGCPVVVEEIWETVVVNGVETKRKLVNRNVNGKLVDVIGSKWQKVQPQTGQQAFKGFGKTEGGK